MIDDLQVVEDLWESMVLTSTLPYNDRENSRARFSPALARLREREAQLTEERNTALEAMKQWNEYAKEYAARAEVAEARVAELIGRCQHLSTFQVAAEILEARVAELKRSNQQLIKDNANAWTEGWRAPQKRLVAAEARVEELERQMLELKMGWPDSEPGRLAAQFLAHGEEK